MGVILLAVLPHCNHVDLKEKQYLKINHWQICTSGFKNKNKIKKLFCFDSQE